MLEAKVWQGRMRNIWVEKAGWKGKKQIKPLPVDVAKPLLNCFGANKTSQNLEVTPELHKRERDGKESQPASILTGSILSVFPLQLPMLPPVWGWDRTAEEHENNRGDIPWYLWTIGGKYLSLLLGMTMTQKGQVSKTQKQNETKRETRSQYQQQPWLTKLLFASRRQLHS